MVLFFKKGKSVRWEGWEPSALNCSGRVTGAHTAYLSGIL